MSGLQKYGGHDRQVDHEANHRPDDRFEDAIDRVFRRLGTYRQHEHGADGYLVGGTWAKAEGPREQQRQHDDRQHDPTRVAEELPDAVGEDDSRDDANASLNSLQKGLADARLHDEQRGNRGENWQRLFENEPAQ